MITHANGHLRKNHAKGINFRHEYFIEQNSFNIILKADHDGSTFATSMTVKSLQIEEKGCECRSAFTMNFILLNTVRLLGT